jgi:KEOPS complex subunit Pcc1
VTHETVLSITYATPERARRVERAIAPEIGDIDDDRSSTRLARDADELSVTVEAADLVALRAAINTWLSLVSVAEDVGGA